MAVTQATFREVSALSINDQETIFFDLLEDVLQNVVIPSVGNDHARNVATMAVRQLQRVMVDITAVPKIRSSAIASYKALLPEIRLVTNEALCSSFESALSDSSASNWNAIDNALSALIPALMERSDESARALIKPLIEIDSGVRDQKERVWIDRNQAVHLVEEKLTGGLSDTQQLRLLDFLKRSFPAERELKIAGVKAIPGGFSKQTFFVNLAETAGLPDVLVMRCDSPYVSAGTSVTMEFPVIEAMYRNGVTVPAPLALDPGEVLGRPLMLLERVPGRSIGDVITVAEPSKTVALDLALKLARLHAAPVHGLEGILRGGTERPEARLLADIEMYDNAWKSVVNHQSFLVEVAIKWLKLNIHLAAGRRAIVHCDVGVHNLLVHDEKVTAFLDWETCVVGTPAEDIGYLHYTITQMMDWHEFLAVYEAAVGAPLDREQVEYFILWGSVRLAIMCNKYTDPVFSGERRNLSEYYLGEYIGQTMLKRVAERMARLSF